MRATWLVVSMALLAGCNSPSDPVESPGIFLSEGCQFGVCVATTMPEVDFQPGAAAVLTFAVDEPTPEAMVATADGWAWLRGGSDGGRFVEFVDASTTEFQRTRIADGASILPDGLRVEGGALWFATNGEPVQLHRIDDAGHTTWPLAIQSTVKVGGVSDNFVLLHTEGVNMKAWTFRLADGTVDGVKIEPGTVGLALRGDTLLRAQLQENDSNVTAEDLVSGSTSEWIIRADVAGIWADRRNIALSTRDSSGDPTAMHLLDPFLHTSWNTLIVGERFVFTHGKIHFETPQEGANPLLRTWILESDGVTAGFFLPPPFLWAASDDGLWWLEEPRVDHRFDEAPNPTAFALMLMAPT